MAKTTSGNQAGRWRRVLRPLWWWLLLVLLLFGIHTHQRLMEQTRLNFTITLTGQPMEAGGLLDRKLFSSGQNISLGSHTFTISNPRIETFTTNFFAWYGKHDLGEIKLRRGMGTLNVNANPPATIITITGPEFSTTLSNSPGTNVTVPTDQYEVHAEYPHWSQAQNVTVFADQTVPCVFAPRFGALRLAANKDEVTYRLQSAAETYTGDLPTTLTGLPTGKYQLTATYHRRQLKEAIMVEADTTNEVPVTFAFGSAHIETVPSGADVRTADGSYWGRTPLDLSEVMPQAAQLNLSLSGYEPVAITLEITADQTASYQTNLVSARYQSAMQEARASLAAGNYDAAFQTTAEVLNTMPGDADALALQSEADSHLGAEREQLAQLKRPREVFDALCRQNADAGLFDTHELKTDKPAKDLAAAIAKALADKPDAFEILVNDSPKPDVYEIMARQTFSLGILGGTERVCLLVVGQTKPGETQILFKVVEYQVKTTVVANGLFNFKDNKQMIPVSPSRMQMTDALENQIRNGVQMVAGKIQTAIGQ